MREHIFLGAYWPARKETRDQCVARISGFLLSISDTEILSKWLLKGGKKRTAMVNITEDGISENLRTNNRDDNQKPIAELGFNIDVWNGNEDSAAYFSARCGVFSKYVSNAVVLRLPAAEIPISEEIKMFAMKLLEKMCAAFNPERAVFTSTEYINRVGADTAAEAGGWITYSRNKGFKINS